MSDWPWDLTFEVDFDTGAGTDPTSWTDLSDRIHAPPSPASAVDVPLVVAGEGGGVTLTLNNRDRALDPTNTAATYNLVPWRHARLSVTVDGTSYPLFRGFVEDWPPSWPEYGQGLIEVRLVDAFAWLSQIESREDFDAEDTGVRVGSLLDSADWPAARRDLDTGLVRVTPYEQDGANALRLLLDTLDAEDGWLYCDPDGDIVFRDRHHNFGITSPALTLGGDGIPITSADPSFGGSGLVNIGRLELADGDVFEAFNSASLAAYGPHVRVTRDLALTPPEAIALTEWEVVQHAEPRLALTDVTVDGHGPDALTRLPLLLAARVGDVVDFSHTPPGGGTAEMRGSVIHIEHRIGKGSWESSFRLDPYQGGLQWFAWDDAANGWDSDAVWAP